MGFYYPMPRGKLQRQRFGEKGKRSFIRKLHNIGRTAGFYLRDSSLQNTQRKITPPPSARPIQGCAQRSFSHLKIPLVGKLQVPAESSSKLLHFFPHRCQASGFFLEYMCTRPTPLAATSCHAMGVLPLCQGGFQCPLLSKHSSPQQGEGKKPHGSSFLPFKSPSSKFSAFQKGPAS